MSKSNMYVLFNQLVHYLNIITQYMTYSIRWIPRPAGDFKYQICLHMQYARADEVDKLKKDYEDGVLALKIFVDTSNERMNAPVQVSFLNIRTFLQDIEVTMTSKEVLLIINKVFPRIHLHLKCVFPQDMKHKVPSMEAVYKTATRNAQQLTKDTSPEEITDMLGVMETIKEELSKVFVSWPIQT